MLLMGGATGLNLFAIYFATLPVLKELLGLLDKAAGFDEEKCCCEKQTLRTEEEKKLASSVRVSVLNVTPAGRTMVGFTDSSSKPPEHYYLPVGDHEAEYVIVPTDGVNDSEEIMPVTVKAPVAPSDDLENKLHHPLIYALGGVLHIEGDNHGTWTTVYDMYGRRYYERPSVEGQIITLDRNRVYIVIVGNYVKKVFL